MLSDTHKKKLTEYFQHKGITKIVLNFFNVKVSKSIKDEVQLEYPYYDGNVKICIPFSKTKWSWKSGIEANKKPKVFGFEVLPQKGNCVFITGGEKDVMTLYSLGLDAICFNSENTDMDEELLNTLKTKFRDVVILFDNDGAGKKFSSNHSKKHNLPFVKWPNEMKGKDVTDFVANGGSKSEIGELTFVAIQRRLKSLPKISCGDLLRINSKEEDYIIKDLIPSNSIVGIIGASDSGKSLLLLQFTICYILNKPYLNRKINGGKKVLICSYEDGAISLKERILKLTQGLSERELEVVFDRLTFIIYSENNIEDIQKHLNAHPETGLVVIDPFSELMAGKDLNSAGEVREVMKQLYSICLDYSLTVAYVHHTGKASEKEGNYSKHNSSGSQAIEAKTRVLLQLKVENNYQRVLAIVKGNDIPISMKYPESKKILEFEKDGSLWFKTSDSKVLARTVRSNKTKVNWEEVYDGAPELKYNTIIQRLWDLKQIPNSTAQKLIKAELFQHKSEKKGFYLNHFHDDNFQL